MTDDSEKADPAHFESADSAQDGDLADSLAIDRAVAEDDEVAPGVPTTASSPRSSGRHKTKREPEPDLSRLDVAGDDAAGAEAPVGGAKRRWRGRKGKRRKAPWWELPLLVAVAILVAVLVKTFVVQPFYIPSQSMEKTLHGCPGCKGDRILVNKPVYDLRDPHPGDIVVFHAPPGWDDEARSVPPSNPVIRAVRGFGQLVGCQLVSDQRVRDRRTGLRALFLAPCVWRVCRRRTRPASAARAGHSAGHHLELGIMDRAADRPSRSRPVVRLGHRFRRCRG